MKKIISLPEGSKRIIGGVVTLTVGFLSVKGIIDAETATYLLGLGGLIFAIGAIDGNKKAKAKKREFMEQHASYIEMETMYMNTEEFKNSPITFDGGPIIRPNRPPNFTAE